VKDAEVSITAARIGKSNASGLMVAPTPERFIPPTVANDLTPRDPAPMLTVAAPGGASVLVPFEVDRAAASIAASGGRRRQRQPDLLVAPETDRFIYRTTD
jgi:hypothetical protein